MLFDVGDDVNGELIVSTVSIHQVVDLEEGGEESPEWDCLQNLHCDQDHDGADDQGISWNHNQTLLNASSSKNAQDSHHFIRLFFKSHEI